MRLTDCFVEIFAYVTYHFKKGNPTPEFEKVTATIQALIEKSDSCFEKGSFTREDFDLARFAVFAWVDETILSSSWPGKNRWLGAPLQRKYYQVADAGELFFKNLNTIGPHQNPVREIYYLCLSLGFTGQYCNEGDDYLLEQLRTSNLKLLSGSSVNVPTMDRELFPEAYANETAIPEPTQPGAARRFSPLTLVGIVAPVGLFGVLFFIYRFILSNVGETLINTVP